VSSTPPRDPLPAAEDLPAPCSLYAGLVVHRNKSVPAARFLCARLDSPPSRIAARSKPVPRRADPARPRLVPARSGRVAAHSARSDSSPCHAARPTAIIFSTVAAVRRRTSPLRVAAVLLRARRCPARPGRSSTVAVPRYGHLAHRVLVSLACAVSHVITGIARAVVVVCSALALFRACRARSLRAIIIYFVIIVRTR
jgi:hypothetical protein